MEVLSHRGLWLTPEEKNTEPSFVRSFSGGYGTETDVRDHDGRLVISHDPATGSAMTLDSFLQLVGDPALPLALNIKADGLAEKLAGIMARHQQQRWFVFDMSVPDMRHHLRVGNPVYARMSEVERHPAWFEQSAGIWLDAFEDTWYDQQLIKDLLAQGKQVCVVSPELHRRPHDPTWQMLRPLAGQAGLSICTDIPDQARHFFSEASR